MHSFLPRTSLVSGLTRVAAVAFLTSCAAAVYAQQPAVSALPTLDLSHPALSLQASFKAPSDLAVSGESSSSASSNSAAEALPADPGVAVSSDDLQPPPRRRRYGRPNYSDKYRNADGSNRLAFVVGGGFNSPSGSASSDFLNLGYRLEAGAGINLNKKLGVLFQFDYDHFGIPDNVLQNQADLYNRLDPTGSNSFSGLGGNAHIWSFTLNPTLNFYQGDKLGAYAVVGGGFYHKVTNFTVPTTQQYCDFYGCYQYTANQIVDHYFSNAPGATGGVGVTYKFSRWGNERLFAEARFVHTFNQARLAGGNNFYPPNSNETSYIPITFGLRF